ncbi:MAG TPA: hypothetical protein VFY36_08265 [Solirubrobacteraceae bacterium]|nr:hypothetical protein [Solirubrobacteraceae bacterium]
MTFADGGGIAHTTARLRSLTLDPVGVSLGVVFLCMSALFLWRTSAVAPLALHGGAFGQYNALADAFLHFHLWIAHIPAQLLGPEPLNPAQKPPILNNRGDDSLYGDKLYLTWGPAPVIVLLVPLHLLGYEPSGSVIMAFFAIVGLGFALAALRATLKLIGDVPPWICILAGVTLASASVVLDLMRGSEVYHQAIIGGYCFTMAGIWLAVSAIVEQRASRVRLGLMSLCFGLATGSRPTLVFTALILVPVYIALKPTRPRASLIVTLAAPIGACLLLLAAYNYARYGEPLEVGSKYQISAGTSNSYWGSLDYIPIGLWSYVLAPPRVSALFPFLSMINPQLTWPFRLPTHYATASEPTGGLLPTTPIAIFLIGIPWMWRRRATPFGHLSPLILTMTGAGASIMLLLSYQVYETSERYEADYATLLVFGSVVLWLILSIHTNGRWRQLMRVGGGLLAVWSCVTGLANGFQGLQGHRGTWRTLVKLGSPVSTELATVAGRPILGDVYAPWIIGAPERYALNTNVSTIWLKAGQRAYFTIVSPDERDVTLAADMTAGPELRPTARLEARVRGPGSSSHTYRVPKANASMRIITHLTRGLNEVVLSPVSIAKDGGSVVAPAKTNSENPLMIVSNIHLADS